jgi:DNA-binding NarL/FixJ family response regulator
LCEINLKPIDGIKIINVVKESMGEAQTPFIIMSRHFDLKDIRKIMNMGADDFIVKPIILDDLIRSVENQLNRINKLRNFCLNEFKVLFNLSPDGIFILDSFEITEANQAFLKMLDIKKEDLKSYTLEHYFGKESITAVKDSIQHCLNGFGRGCVERVMLQTKSGLMKEASFSVATCDNSLARHVMVGLVTQRNADKVAFNYDQSISEVIKILKKEDITISVSIVKRITDLLKRQNSSVTAHECDLFSKRENEVLNLSLEGLPTKLIADKLAISDRTVEKYRSKLMEKTGSNNIIEVIHYALMNKLINM